MADFLGRYLRNLGIAAAILIGGWAVLKLIFPALVTSINSMGDFVEVVRIWPVLLAAVLLLALPWRKE